jgi:SET domain-containing protein
LKDRKYDGLMKEKKMSKKTLHRKQKIYNHESTKKQVQSALNVPTLPELLLALVLNLKKYLVLSHAR